MSTKRSLAFASVEAYASLALYVIGTVIISRLLTPTQIGTFSIASGMFAIASAFRDLGVSEFLIQSKRLTAHRLRLAATANIAASWAMALLFVVLADSIANFYRSPELRNLCYMLAFNFVMIPFGAIGMAYYRRELHFRPMLVASIASSVVGLVVTLVCIAYGYGVYSLGWGAVSGVVVTVAVSIGYRPGWFPWRPATRGIGHVFKFGGSAMGIYLCTQLSKSSPDLINGRAFGPAETAMFSRGMGLVDLLSRLALRPIEAICLPHFSKVHREGGSITDEYSRLISMVSVVGWPALAFIAVFAEPLILTIFGSQWTAAVPLARIACVAMAFELVHYYAREVMVALGRVDIALKIQWRSLIIRLFAVAVGLAFGLIGVATALAVSAAFCLVQIHLLAACLIGCTWRSVLIALQRSAVPAGGAFAVSMLVYAVADHTLSAFILLPSAAILVVVAWFLCIWANDHPIYQEIVSIARRFHRHFRSASKEGG